MLVLTFSVGPMRFAVPTSRLVQIVPRVRLLPVAGFVQAITGLLPVGDDVVPVVDLGLLLTGQPCAERLSTRILICRVNHLGGSERLGVVAEDVTDLHTLAPECVPSAEVSSAAARGLSAMVRAGDQLVQWLDVDRILTEEEKSRVFQQVSARAP